MAEVVLIHGIGQEANKPGEVEAAWRTAMAKGIETGGDEALARRIDNQSSPADAVSVRMSFYGDLFLEPGAQGDGAELEDSNSDQGILALQIASEWVRRASERGSERDRREATRALRHLEPGEDQGFIESTGRTMMNAVARLKWFAPFGMKFAEQFVVSSLVQVSQYLADQGLRRKVQQRVFDQIEEDTRIIVGHSLGSVVAYEVASQLERPLPLLVTLGSPLGLRTIIYDKVLPQPPVYPPKVHRWVNLADKNDLVAAEPNLESLFPHGEGVLQTGWLNSKSAPSGALLNGLVDNGPEPHNATYYLQKWQVGQAIAGVLAG